MQDDIITLPSEFSLLESNLVENKPKYMDYIYEKILSKITKEFHIEARRITLFKFTDTNLTVVVTMKQYLSVVNNLLDYYIKHELYEKCSILNKIKNNIDLNS